MCATIETQCDIQKSYLLLDNVFYGFKKFISTNKNIFSYYKNKVYRFDDKGFVIPDDKLQKVVYSIGYQEINPYKGVYYDVIHREFTNKLGYHIMPISIDFERYELASICLVQFLYDDIQFSDGKDVIVSKFKILSDNYNKVYETLVKVFSDKEYNDGISYFKSIIKTTMKFSNIVKKQIKGKI